MSGEARVALHVLGLNRFATSDSVNVAARHRGEHLAQRPWFRDRVAERVGEERERPTVDHDRLFAVLTGDDLHRPPGELGVEIAGEAVACLVVVVVGVPELPRSLVSSDI